MRHLSRGLKTNFLKQCLFLLNKVCISSLFIILAIAMSAEQVLRCIVVKILFGFTYEDLAFHIVDSQSLRWFRRIGMIEEGNRTPTLLSRIAGIQSSATKYA